MLFVYPCMYPQDHKSFVLFLYVCICLFVFFFISLFFPSHFLLLCFCICFLSIPNLVELLELFNCRHMFNPLSRYSLFFIFEYLVFPPHANLSNLSPTVALFISRC